MIKIGNHALSGEHLINEVAAREWNSDQKPIPVQRILNAGDTDLSTHAVVKRG